MVDSVTPIKTTLPPKRIEEVKADPKAVQKDELAGKENTVAGDNLATARAEVLAGKQPDGTFQFTAPIAAAALDPAGHPVGGSKGQATQAETAAVQQFLNDNTGAGLTVDGKYGGKTKEAIKKFQTDTGLTPVDGVAGKNTINAMIATDGIKTMNDPAATPEAKSEAQQKAKAAIEALPADSDARKNLQAKFDAVQPTAPDTNPNDPAKTQLAQNLQTANNSNASPEARADALGKAKENLEQMKRDASGLQGSARQTAEAEIAKATADLGGATTKVTQDVTAAATQASGEYKAAVDQAKAAQDAVNAAGTNATKAQKDALAAANARADELGKKAESALKGAETLGQNSALSSDQRRAATTAAEAGRNVQKEADALRARTGPARTAEQKALLDQAIVNANNKGDQSYQDVGNAIGDALLKQPGDIPDGTVTSMLNGITDKGFAGMNGDDIATAIIQKLGPAGLAKLSKADQQALGNALGAVGLWGEQRDALNALTAAGAYN